MATTNLDELYIQHIKPLPTADRLRLMAIIADALIPETEVAHKRSLLELEGLGAEMWNAIDAQQYVNELREEWDHRP